LEVIEGIQQEIPVQPVNSAILMGLSGLFLSLAN